MPLFALLCFLVESLPMIHFVCRSNMIKMAIQQAPSMYCSLKQYKICLITQDNFRDFSSYLTNNYLLQGCFKMYDNWIYNHLINTSYFVAVCLSLPLAFGVW